MNYFDIIAFFFLLLQQVFAFQLPLFANTPKAHLNSIRNLLTVNNLLFLNNTNYLFYIPLCFGIPQQCFNVLYDTGSQPTYLYNSTVGSKIKHTYNPFVSKTKKDSIDKDVQKEIKEDTFGNEISDIISNFTSDKSKLFNFYLINSIKHSQYLPYDGILGLNRVYNKSTEYTKRHILDVSDDYSIMEYLYKNRFIKHKIFGHYINPNTNEGTFFLGEDGTGNYKYNYNKCSSNGMPTQYVSNWQCQCNQIIINDKPLQLDITSFSLIFDSTFYFIKVPGRIAHSIYIEIIGEKFYNDNCKLMNLDSYGMGLFCDKLPESVLPNITLSIKEGFTVSISTNNLFIYTHYQKFDEQGYWGYVCLITSDVFLSNEIILGKIFMANYYMIFNYEDNTVGFIIGNPSLHSENDIIILIIKYLSLIVISNIVLLLISVYYHNKLKELSP